MDIAEPCGFDRELALKNINEIRPGIRTSRLLRKTGVGMEDWLGYLAEERVKARGLSNKVGGCDGGEEERLENGKAGSVDAYLARLPERRRGPL